MRKLHILAGLLLTLMACAAHVGGAQADTNQLAIIQADGQLATNMTGTLDQMRALGATQIRFAVRWESVAPDVKAVHPPGGFNAANPADYPKVNWLFLDNLVREATADHMSVDFLVTGPGPRWAEAAGEPRGGPFGVWKPNPVEYGQFVQALGTRYSGRYLLPGTKKPLPRINFWGIWNEPNFGVDLAPQATDHDLLELSPASYRQLVKNAWNALGRTGHLAHDTVLVGETAPHGHTHPIGNFDLIAPQRWIDVLYCLSPTTGQHLLGAAAAQRGCPATEAGIGRFRADNPGLFNATGFAVHPYASGVPPNVSQTGSVVGAADLAALPAVEKELSHAFDAYGDHRAIPLYNTEYGYQVGGQVTFQDAAAYINWAEYISYKDPRIKSYAQYLLNDPANGGFETGLFSANGIPHPSLAAYRMPLYLPVATVTTPRLLEVWGDVRPAFFAQFDTQRAQHVTIQFRADGSASWTTERILTITNQRGYFDTYIKFPRSGTVRTQWTDPSGNVLHSRLVSVTL